MIKERIKWHRIAQDAEELRSRIGGNGLLRVFIKKEPICIVQQNKQFLAIGDKCPHQGASLAGGWCEEGKVVCPMHRYRFDPASGKGFDGEGERAASYPLEQREEGLCVGFEYTTFSLFGIDLW